MPKERETREIIKRLRSEGWQEELGKGSHRPFRKAGVTLSVPTSKKEQKLAALPSLLVGFDVAGKE